MTTRYLTPEIPESAVRVGARVELHPATDAWMMGDRFGTVCRVGTKWVAVMMDNSNKERRFPLGRENDALYAVEA